MIITLSLNPCIDRILRIQKFNYGGMNRVVESQDDACGKAVNLALVAAELGAKVKCVGLLPDEDGTAVSKRLHHAGVQTDFLGVPGRLRVNIKLLDDEQRITTEINERGAPVGGDVPELLTARILSALNPGDWLILSGSMPNGFSPDYYAELIKRLRGICNCALDAEGEALKLGIIEGPALIKPNKAELEILLGRKVEGMDDAISAATAIRRDHHVGRVVVSMGELGAVMIDEAGALIAPAVKVKVNSTVGAGDSMLAALCCGLSVGKSSEGAFRMGMAAAAACVASEGLQLAEHARYESMLVKTSIRRL